MNDNEFTHSRAWRYGNMVPVVLVGALLAALLWAPIASDFAVHVVSAFYALWFAGWYAYISYRMHSNSLLWMGLACGSLLFGAFWSTGSARYAFLGLVIAGGLTFVACSLVDIRRFRRDVQHYDELLGLIEAEIAMRREILGRYNVEHARLATGMRALIARRESEV